jgi:hypothetical protein
MAYRTLNLKTTGVSPLLLHNGQLADPLSPIVAEIKKVSGKRGKTEADHRELARLEWLGSMYLRDGKPCVPGENIEATFVEAARKSRVGKQALAGIICPDAPLVEYNGPSDINELWLLPDFRLTVGAKVQRARIMRTRPMFKEWALQFRLMFNDAVLNESQVFEIMQVAGELVGLCDWRPKFGRFVTAIV